MCGIAGFYKKKEVHLKPDIKKISDLLSHRGPDHSGHIDNETVFLFHSRLKIIDLADTANQPMINEDSGDALIFNGEIYNYKKLRVYLQGLGCVFKTQSDTEVLLKGMSKLGVEFASMLDGDFAFAFWNSKTKQLVVARDPFGIKPLYYGYTNGVFCFSSEIRPLLEMGIEKKLNTDRLADYLRYRYIPGDQTLFKGINHLPPGHFALVGENQFDLIKFYQVKPTNNQVTSLDQFHTAFLESFSTRLNADVEISLLLSGGVDSSALAALAALQKKENLKAFTYLFKGSVEASQDVSRAKNISEKFGLNHEIINEESNFTSSYKKIIAALEEPIGDAIIFANYELMKSVSKHARVALCGEGADEIFCGYAHHRAGKWPLRLLNFPKIRKIISFFVAHMPTWLMDSFGIYPSKLALHGKRRLLQVLKADTASEIYKGLVSLFDEGEIRSILKCKIGLDSLVFETDFQTTDFQNWLPKYSLIRLDKLSMAHSVETRFPYLSVFMLTAAKQLNLNSVRVLGIDKKNFRSYCYSYLGIDMRNLRKYPFYRPAESFLNSDYISFLRETLSNDRIGKYNIFDKVYVCALLNDLDNSTDFIAHKKLDSLAILQLWLEEFWPGGY